MLAFFFFFNGEFIKFNSFLRRLSVSTDEHVFMKKALHGNTPRLQASAAMAPAGPCADASRFYPRGSGANRGTPAAWHSLRRAERVGLSSEV